MSESYSPWSRPREQMRQVGDNSISTSEDGGTAAKNLLSHQIEAQ